MEMGAPAGGEGGIPGSNYFKDSREVTDAGIGMACTRLPLKASGAPGLVEDVKLQRIITRNLLLLRQIGATRRNDCTCVRVTHVATESGLVGEGHSAHLAAIDIDHTNKSVAERELLHRIRCRIVHRRRNRRRFTSVGDGCDSFGGLKTQVVVRDWAMEVAISRVGIDCSMNLRIIVVLDRCHVELMVMLLR